MIDFEENRGLVYDVFNKSYQSVRYLEDDLIQEGMIALWKACTDYDENKGIEFSTYATICISNAMGMFMRKENRISQRCVSLEDTIGPDTDVKYIDSIESEDFEKLGQSAEIEHIVGIMEDLPGHELGLMKLQGKTQAEIAKELGITQCSVSEQLAALYACVRDRLGVEQPKKKRRKKKIK